MGHLLGYARVSTTDQQPQLQVGALERAGCYRVFVETASGARSDRPTLAQLLDQLRPGDTLVVWKLDRLGRSLRHLVDTVTGLADRGVGFRSLQEAIDTTTPGGKLVFHVTAHRAGIVAALLHGLSNARVESVNTKLRVLTRLALGFRSPDALIGLAMLSVGGLCPELPGRAQPDPRISQ